MDHLHEKAAMMALMAMNTDHGVLIHQESDTATKILVTVRCWPLSLCDRDRLEEAGLDGVESRWLMRCSYPVQIFSEDSLTVNDSRHEILAWSVTKDESGVEWTLLTRAA
jgi:hypothetical protein